MKQHVRRGEEWKAPSPEEGSPDGGSQCRRNAAGTRQYTCRKTWRRGSQGTLSSTPLAPAKVATAACASHLQPRSKKVTEILLGPKSVSVLTQYRKVTTIASVSHLLGAVFEEHRPVPQRACCSLEEAAHFRGVVLAQAAALSLDPAGTKKRKRRKQHRVTAGKYHLPQGHVLQQIAIVGGCFTTAGWEKVHEVYESRLSRRISQENTSPRGTS